MSLDRFLPEGEDNHTAVQERCSNPKCRKPIGNVKYTLTVKGKEGLYCQTCAKKILSPREDSEEPL